MSKTRWTWSTETVFQSVRGAGKPILQELLGQLHAHGWTEHEIFGIHLAVEEAVVNAIKHGNRLDETKNVHVNCKLSPERMWIEIVDEGPGFNPACVPDPTAPENLEVPCGRGIMLMRSFMSQVEFSATGNGVVMEKAREKTSG